MSSIMTSGPPAESGTAAYRYERAQLPDGVFLEPAMHWLVQLTEEQNAGGLTVMSLGGVLLRVAVRGRDGATDARLLVLQTPAVQQGDRSSLLHATVALHAGMHPPYNQGSCFGVHCRSYTVDEAGRSVADDFSTATAPLDPYDARELELRASVSAALREAATGEGGADPIVNRAAFALFQQLATSHCVDPAVTAAVVAAHTQA